MSRPGPKIRIWEVTYRRGRGRPWYVRWTVDGRERGPKTFATEEEAEDWRARLRIASRDGLKWNMSTGLPVSWNPLIELDVASFCRTEWTRRTRNRKDSTAATLAESMSRFVAATMPPRAPEIPGSFADLSRWIQGVDVSGEMSNWIDRWSPQMGSLDKTVLERTAKALMEGNDGYPLSANVVRHRFTEALALLDRAVEEDILQKNELTKPDSTTYEDISTDRSKVYPSIAEMLAVVEAVETRNPASRVYRAMTAVGVLAGCRPSEVVALEMSHVDFPEFGWGMLSVEQARIGVRGISEDVDEIGRPKNRRSVRKIPIHAALVAELRRFVEGAGITTGPLFRTRNGTLPDNWGRSLDRATAATGVRALSPYDLRRFHGTWLAESGVPYNEAARRMGHSLEVYMRHYVLTTTGVEAAGNAAIDRVLG